MVAGQRVKYSSILYRFQVLSVWIPDFPYFIHPRSLNLAPEKATGPHKEN